MTEKTFGSLNGRQLYLYFNVPWSMRACKKGQFHFSWRAALNPKNWWQAMKYRSNWALHCRRWKNTNHRCYCQCGSMIDGRISICGFSMNWWYSRFTGTVPCPCDEMIEEMEGGTR